MRARFANMCTYSIVLVLLAVLCAPGQASGYYIPGATPKYYSMGDPVEFRVNSLRSASNTYPMYYYSLPFCQPKTIKNLTESIGEIIWGDRQANSLYEVHMGHNRFYKITDNCDTETTTKQLYDDGKKGIKNLKNAIDRGYRGMMNIDNLPAFFDGKTAVKMTDCTNTKVTEKIKKSVYGSLRGYPLGVPSSCTGKAKVFNHLHFKIAYNPDTNEKDKNGNTQAMVVGLKVVPYSIQWTDLTLNTQLNQVEEPIDFAALAETPLEIATKVEETQVTFFWTYSTEWNKSSVVWASRWDEYFHSSVAGSVATLHYTYACTSIIIVLLAASITVSILLRALHKDFNRYNSEDPEDLQEETGWKLVHADVFRPPDRSQSLAILAGNGYQVLGICGGVLVFAVLGFLSPSRRGALLMAILVLFIVMSIFNGYVCGFFLTYFGKRSWRPVFLSGCAFPGAICGTYLFFDIISYAKGSTAAAPFTTILLILALWIFASVPLTLLGASAAFGQGRPEDPVRVGRLAREIPKQVGLNSRTFLYLVPPFFPLATIITELYFVMQGLWAGAIFYAFGFLTFVGILWAIVCALVAVSQVYYVLCYENHRWWWYSFMIPGCMGLHLFGFSVVFFFSQLQITSFASGLMYFSYMGLISFGYGVAAGAIGLTACLAFVRAIYRSIKID